MVIVSAHHTSVNPGCRIDNRATGVYNQGMTEPRIEKLPRWAQDHIRSLVATIADQALALESLTPTDQHAPIQFTLHGDRYSAPFGVSRVLFTVNNSKSDLPYGFEVIHLGDKLSVRTTHSVMTVNPKAANSIEVSEGGDD